MRKIAIYGKGGSGKSTVASAMAVSFARRGLTVLLVGCDPKADSTLAVTGGARVPTLLQLLEQGVSRPEPERFVRQGRFGIDCIEAGGPEPGAGCGGRGIARMFDLFQDIDLMGKRAYDVVLFDVLGDVVCGGFAAPLRYGFADRAFIVVSEEPLSLFAANNIIRAIAAYHRCGVRMGGLIVNTSDGVGGLERVERYAGAIHASITGVLPRDPEIQEAEARHLTAAELPPDSPTSAAIESLADRMMDSFRSDSAAPESLPVEELFRLVGNNPAARPDPPASERNVAPAAHARPRHPERAGAPILELGRASLPSSEGPPPCLGTAAAPAAHARPRHPERAGAPILELGRASLPSSEGPPPCLGTAAAPAAHARPRHPERAGAPILELGRASLPSSEGPQLALAQPYLSGGPRSCAAVAELLGFGRGGARAAGPKVTAFSRVGDEYRLDIALPSHGKSAPTRGRVKPAPGCVQLRLGRAEPGAACFATAGSLALSYSGQIDDAGRALLDRIVERLSAHPVSLEQLADLLARDGKRPSDAVAGEGATQGGAAPAATPRHWCVWGRELMQGVFFYDQERERQLASRVRLGGARTLSIHHATSECQFSKQKDTPYTTHFIRSPHVIERSEHTHREKSDWVSTRIGDYQMIAGSNESLRRVLEQAADRVDEWDAVSVYVSCVPVISGEDFGGAIREFTLKTGKPVMIAGTTGTDLKRGFLEVALDALAARPAGAPARLPGTVNLVGFPGTRATWELCALLACTGVSVGQQQLPVLDLERLVRFEEAQAQLLFPMVEYERLYKGLFEPLPVPVVRVPPPFGVDGTVRFLEAALDAAGVDRDEGMGRVSGDLDAVRAELEPLRARAGRHRLGIAVTSAQAEHLVRPERVCGIPLVEFLSELGFRVEVLRQSEDPARLDWWLGSGLSAVCTDVAHDERLLRRGVGQFGLADLEPGLAGAVRTLRRLLSACELPFVRDFAHYSGEGTR